MGSERVLRYLQCLTFFVAVRLSPHKMYVDPASRRADRQAMGMMPHHVFVLEENKVAESGSERVLEVKSLLMW